MSNPLIPPLPLPDDDRLTSNGVTEPEVDDPAITRPDGDRALDPDLDESLIDSAAADRLATGAESSEEASEER